MDLLTWLQESPLGWVAESAWGYPIVLSAHAVGMGIVVGTVTMICLRLLGFATKVPIRSLEKMSSVAWLGVAVNVSSGVFLFAGDPTKFFFHRVFWTKIALIVLGALSVWQLLRTVRALPAESLEVAVPLNARRIAACSLALWMGALVAGRLIAYT
jgi:hypothetical protein